MPSTSFQNRKRLADQEVAINEDLIALYQVMKRALMDPQVFKSILKFDLSFAFTVVTSYSLIVSSLDVGPGPILISNIFLYDLIIINM